MTSTSWIQKYEWFHRKKLVKILNTSFIFFEHNNTGARYIFVLIKKEEISFRSKKWHGRLLEVSCLYFHIISFFSLSFVTRGRVIKLSFLSPCGTQKSQGYLWMTKQLEWRGQKLIEYFWGDLKSWNKWLLIQPSFRLVAEDLVKFVLANGKSLNTSRVSSLLCTLYIKPKYWRNVKVLSLVFPQKFIKVLKCWNYSWNKFCKSIDFYIHSSFTANVEFVGIDATSMNKLFILPVMPKPAIIKVKKQTSNSF